MNKKVVDRFDNFLDDHERMKHLIFVAKDREQQDRMHRFVNIEILFHEQHSEVMNNMLETFYLFIQSGTFLCM